MGQKIAMQMGKFAECVVDRKPNGRMLFTAKFMWP